MNEMDCQDDNGTVQYENYAQNEQLCDLCRNIDFDYLKHNEVCEEERIDLGTWGSIMAKKDDCSFCSLIFQIYRVAGTKDSRSHDKRISLQSGAAWECVASFPPWFGESSFFRISTRVELNLHAEQATKLACRLGISEEGVDKYESVLAEEIQYIKTNDDIDPANPSAATFLGRRVGSKVDIKLLNSWIDRCKACHRSACNSLETPTRKTAPNRLRVIDVNTRRIVLVSITSGDVSLCPVTSKTTVRDAHMQGNSSRLNPSIVQEGSIDSSGAINYQNLHGETSIFGIIANSIDLAEPDEVSHQFSQSPSISLLQNEGYVALSYVWGEGSLKNSSKTPWTQPKLLEKHIAEFGAESIPLGALAQSLPRTIEDAIYLTSALGYSYLWVDALCLVQDSYSMQEEVLAMDIIYGDAALTIAAATNTHSNDGLPGIRNPRRHNQIQRNVKGHTLAVVFPKFETQADSRNLHWNTRGWTFQEKLLSRKLLVFTELQVFWKCTESIWCEDVDAEINELDPEIHGKLQWPRDRNELLSRQRDITPSLWNPNIAVEHTDFIRILELYTTRSLSNPYDVLPAAHGLIQSFGTQQFSGIPVERFPHGLLWVSPFQPILQPKVKDQICNKCFHMPDGSLIRQLQPTWSWASFPSHKLWSRKTPIRKYYACLSITFFQNEHVYRISNEFLPQKMSEELIRTSINDDILSTLGEMSALLVQAPSIRMRIQEPIDNFEFNFEYNFSDDLQHSCAWFTLRDKSGEICGEIWTSRHVVALLGDKQPLLVAMCFNDEKPHTVLGQPFMPALPEGPRGIHLNAIEALAVWDDGPIYRRIGIARVAWEAWKRAKCELEALVIA